MHVSYKIKNKWNHGRMEKKPKVAECYKFPKAWHKGSNKELL